MEIIKNYTDFYESHNTPSKSIYEWFEHLKSIQWGKKPINESNLKFWTEHFIGEGWFDIIKNKFLDTSKSLEKVNYDDIYDRLYDLWDEIPLSKQKMVYPAIAYASFDDYYKNKINYTGTLFHKTENINSYIIHFLKEIIYFTSFIGYPSRYLRTTEEQEYVLDKKWNCANFDIKNYSIKEGDELTTSRGKTNVITGSDIKGKENFNLSKMLDLYQPCVIIDIGGYDNSIRTGTFDINKIESILDDSLEIILPQLDYKEVIWDHSRFERRFDSTDFHDYTLKIILN